MDDEVLEEFMIALFDGEFIDNKHESYPELDSMEGCAMVFVDSVGITTGITIYEEGYVSMENKESTVFLAEVDAEICVIMIERMQN